MGGRKILAVALVAVAMPLVAQPVAAGGREPSRRDRLIVDEAIDATLDGANRLTSNNGQSNEQALLNWTRVARDWKEAAALIDRGPRSVPKRIRTAFSRSLRSATAALLAMRDCYKRDPAGIECLEVETRSKETARVSGQRTRDLIPYGTRSEEDVLSLLIPSTATPVSPTATVPTTQATAPVNSPYMSLAEFNQIQSGMSYDQVAAIVGSPGSLLSESNVGGYNGQIFMWPGEGGTGANANVQFQNGAVISKAQFGLR